MDQHIILSRRIDYTLILKIILYLLDFILEGEYTVYGDLCFMILSNLNWNRVFNEHIMSSDSFKCSYEYYRNDNTSFNKAVKKHIFPNFRIDYIMCMKNGWEVATYCGLFLSLTVKNCSMFTLYALLNSNICLDGIEPGLCNCLSRLLPVFIIFMRHVP